MTIHIERPRPEPPAPAPARRSHGSMAVLGVLFGIYLVLLAWIILFKLEAPYLGSGGARTLKLVPFVRTVDYGSSAPREVLANIVLFIPFGVYLAVLAPRVAVLRRIAWLVGASAALEALQFVLAVGSTDISDVIANTAGGVFGLLTAMLLRWCGVRPPLFATACLVGTAVAVLVCAAYVTGG